MTRMIGAFLSVLLVLGLTALQAQTTSAQIAFVLNKSVETPRGDNMVNEGERFSITIEARVTGAVLWAVLDEVPSGFVVESAQAGAGGTSAFVVRVEGPSTVVFVAESTSAGIEARAKITYTVLASVGGTYILPGALGLVRTEEGWLVATSTPPTREIIVISKLQGEVSGLSKRLDAVDSRVAELIEALNALKPALDEFRSEVNARITRMEEDLFSLSSLSLRLLVIIAIAIAAIAVVSAWVSPLVSRRRGGEAQPLEAKPL